MSPTAQRYGYSTAEMLAIDKAVIDASVESGIIPKPERSSSIGSDKIERFVH